MKARLLNAWDDLRASYWFIPSVMALGAIALSFVVTAIDGRVGSGWIEGVDWLYGNRPEGARALLSTIAGSMITVAGVVFSITVAAVVYASGQYGPRLLTNFMRDRGSKVTLGTFIATFLYCILVLRTVRSADEPVGGDTPAEDVVGAFVPHIAVLTGLALAVASIVVLIYFIHHIPGSIHVSNVIAEIGRELAAKVGTLFPERMGRAVPGPVPPARHDGLPERFYEDAVPVAADGTGYVQNVDDEGLLAAAREHDLLLRMRYRPGDFVSAGDALLLAWPAERVDDGVCRRLRGAFVWGRARTTLQDVRFLVDELVEIAARALSPGVNDPFTAVSCLDWLGAALKELADREIPGARRYDEDGALRVVAEPYTFADFVEAALGQLRPYVAADRNAALHTFEVLGGVAGRAGEEGQRAALRAEADRLLAACEEALPHEADREAARARHRVVVRVLSGHRAFEAVSAEHDWLGGRA